jgi:hypothetical protein
MLNEHVRTITASGSVLSRAMDENISTFRVCFVASYALEMLWICMGGLRCAIWHGNVFVISSALYALYFARPMLLPKAKK